MVAVMNDYFFCFHVNLETLIMKRIASAASMAHKIIISFFDIFPPSGISL